MSKGKVTTKIETNREPEVVVATMFGYPIVKEGKPTAVEVRLVTGRITLAKFEDTRPLDDEARTLLQGRGKHKA